MPDDTGEMRAGEAEHEHRWDDGDSQCQAGFYLLCLGCGEKEWTE